MDEEEVLLNLTGSLETGLGVLGIDVGPVSSSAAPKKAKASHEPKQQSASEQAHPAPPEPRAAPVVASVHSAQSHQHRDGTGTSKTTTERVRVPVMYTHTTSKPDADAPLDSSKNTKPNPDVVAAKQIAARAAIRDALGVDHSYAPEAPYRATAGGTASTAEPAHALSDRPSSIRRLPIETSSCKALPSPSAGSDVSLHGSAAPVNGAAAQVPASTAGSVDPASRLVPPGPGDDVSGWLSCDAFDSLGLETRLVAKLTAPKQAVGGALGGAPHADADASMTAGTAVTRGHTRDGFGLSRPTRVQRLFIPPALAGRSLCAKSETGSGKTLAFLTPILHSLLTHHAPSGGGLSRSSGLHAIVLAPTRELCQQIFTVASRLVQPFPFIVPGLVAGGEKRKAEKARLRKGVSLLVATPGRLLDHLRTTQAVGREALRAVRWLVLDEADRLLDMGFGPQLADIVGCLRAAHAALTAGGSLCGPAWRTYLLSATLSSRVRSLAASVLADGDTATLLDASSLSMSATGDNAAAAGAALLSSMGIDTDDDSDDSSDKKEEGAGADKSDAVAKRRDDRAQKGGPRDMVTPSRLTQQYVIGALKWRLPTLLALLVDSVTLARKGRKASALSAEGGTPPASGCKLILFMATCDSVDLHWSLLKMLLPGMLRAQGQTGAVPSSSSTGSASAPAPGGGVRVIRLHGDMAQGKRTSAIRSFSTSQAHGGVSLLVTTDVAARGLDLPSVDVIVQADPPSDTQDYVHRVGRTARAGQAGRAVLLLQPHESPYVELLAAAGLTLHRADVSPIFAALARCPVPTQLLTTAPVGGSGAAEDGKSGKESGGSGGARNPGAKARQPASKSEGADNDDSSGAGHGEGGGGGSFSRKVASLMEAAERSRNKGKAEGAGGAQPSTSSSSSRWAELQAVLWQTLIEGIVTTHPSPLSAPGSSSGGDGPSSHEPLIDLARRAFASFVRAYATHEKATRHIFHPRALHLGHAAKACGLTEQPTQVVARSSKAARKKARIEEVAAATVAKKKAARASGSKRRRDESQGAADSAAQHAVTSERVSGSQGSGADRPPAKKARNADRSVPPGSSKSNRLSWAGPTAGEGSYNKKPAFKEPSHEDDREGGDGSGGGGDIRKALLAKARKVVSRKATMSEFEA